jgi:hypothetical protein
MGKALTTFEKLQDYSKAPPQAIEALIGDMTLTVSLLITATDKLKTEALAQVTAFGDASGKLFDGMKKAMDVFTGLNQYTRIPSTVITAFISDIILTVNLTIQMTAKIENEMLLQVTNFGVAVGKLFDGLKKAMDVFKDLEKFKSTPSEVITAFINEIILTVNLAANMANLTNTELLSKAQKFAARSIAFLANSNRRSMFSRASKVSKVTRPKPSRA